MCLCGDLEEQQKEIKEHQGMIPMLQNQFDALASESAVSRDPYDTVLNRMHKSVIVKLVTKATEEQKNGQDAGKGGMDCISFKLVLYPTVYHSHLFCALNDETIYPSNKNNSFPNIT